MSQTPQEFMLEYETATQSQDLDAVLALIDDEAVYMFSDESVHVGKPAIESAIRRNFQLIKDEVYSMENVTWLAERDDVAACVYDYSWSGTINGELVSGSGRGTNVLKRALDGWKVVHEHLSKGTFAA